MTVTDTSAAFFPGLGQHALYDNVTAWLAERVPADWMATMSASSTEQQLAFQKGWFASLVAAGLAVPQWPTGAATALRNSQPSTARCWRPARPALAP